MKITRLRLLGFKSFVEPTELLVEPGLTGVVGPNGCGKSNLLEALRWVMGESSHKNMRAAAMEDIIFAGTQNRPARNMAEVSIHIDNSDRTAPAEFNDSDELEVSRRIEREAGSAYKINGKDVRARDVRLLFEDAATGARSPALVRQGRIGEIVNARPQERRRILEDAAGIAGLHSRRHEAELRLRAAEANLERLSDVMGQLESQLQALKRQSRQARRYKDLSAKIREAEALQHHLLWTAACAAVTQEEAALAEALRDVGHLTQAESAALRAQAEAAERLPPLREEEATRAAVLHRLSLERDALDSEEARARERRAELTRRIEQLNSDLERERQTVGEAQEIVERLATEARDIEAALADASRSEPSVRAAAQTSAQALKEAEAAFADRTAELADARARRRQLESQAESLRARIARSEETLATLAQRAAAIGTEASGETEIERLRGDVEAAQAELAAKERDTLAAEQRHVEARTAETAAREIDTRAALRAQELATQVQTLRGLLMPPAEEAWPPVLDAVRVAAGYERALGAALGEDLAAPADARAPVHWGQCREATDDPELPPGVLPMSRFVEAPPVLARRLDQIGIVERAQGKILQAALKPGQRLVSVEGDLWRWDGYTAAADAPSAAAQRLAERNRLESLMPVAEAARDEAAAAAASLAAAAEATKAAEAEERRLRQEWRSAQAALAKAHDALARAEAERQEKAKQRAALAEARKQAEQARAEAVGLLGETNAAIETLPATQMLEAALAAESERLESARTAAAEARAALESVERERRQRQGRLAAVADERTRWESRRHSAEGQIGILRTRIEEAAAELEAMADLPERIAERRQRLLSEIANAERQRREAADAVVAAEGALKERDTALKETQARLSQAREVRARCEVRLEAAREKRSAQAKAIRDALGCAPDACLAQAGIDPASELPSLAETEARLAGLRADRERLGAVNLRAEEEAEALAGQLSEMQRERDDCQEAITRLRQAIANLNREGRQRLLAAFDTVQAHFQSLFQTLFGGGKAELQLVESDDPLESGLEIVACPPGKKPQTITLLSGGEKALTAMALIFAVFLTNPSPICVLDEVDAPLDDANVERFCNLMDEMRRMTDTRFLIITHHPMTMARMDRLFGVTMSERGVSQLVSVDLEAAERLREAG